MASHDILILIPARMAATRLPGKPLADIGGQPMIAHVIRRAQEAKLGPVIVATDDEVIFAAVEKTGVQALMTRTDHASGSDRIFEALELAEKIQYIELTTRPGFQDEFIVRMALVEE